jgi:Cu2+-exporting ATPase
VGRPELANAAALSVEDKPFALALARASRHPISQAIRRALESEGVVAAALDDITEIPGQGLTALDGQDVVRLGRPDGNGFGASLAVQFQRGSAPPIILTCEDPMRSGAQATLSRLRDLGIESSIASGDRAEAVLPVARLLGLTAQTGMQPQDKLDTLARLAKAGHRVLMVGDGMNDGPALVAGHASMAPASASDAGQNAADAVFMGDSLAPVAIAVTAARATQRIVKQNFALAIGYNMVAVPLAIMGLVTPLIAALAMSSSSIIVVANALRLKRAAQ